MLGRCYEQGWGAEPDLRLATEAFQMAADAGHGWAQVNLAHTLMRRGDPADRFRCFAIFRAAAEGGTSAANLKAMNSLARFLEEGWVLPADPKGALYWYSRAAVLGDHWAQYNLATILHNQGDVTAADAWLGRSIAGGDDGFRRRIAPLLVARDEIALRRRGLEALEHIAASGQREDLHAYGSALYEMATDPSDIEKAKRLLKLATPKERPIRRVRVSIAAWRLPRALRQLIKPMSLHLAMPAKSKPSCSKEAM